MGCVLYGNCDIAHNGCTDSHTIQVKKLSFLWTKTKLQEEEEKDEDRCWMNLMSNCIQYFLLIF